LESGFVYLFVFGCFRFHRVLFLLPFFLSDCQAAQVAARVRWPDRGVQGEEAKNHVRPGTLSWGSEIFFFVWFRFFGFVCLWVLTFFFPRVSFLFVCIWFLESNSQV
jgi:hypothetical protein